MANSGDRSNWDPFLFELQGTVHESYAAEAVLLGVFSGSKDVERRRVTQAMDTDRSIFHGSQIRHTVDLSTMQSGGWPGESGTWNAPSAINAVKVFDKLCDFVQPFSVTVDVERDSMSASNAAAVTRLTMKAGQACAIQENLALNGDGTGLQATITDSATSLTTTVTGANWDVLLPGTIWDVLTRSTGADPGQGLRRQIASVAITSPTAGTITWSTNATASDGGSGNIVHASTSGVYIAGSYSTPGTTDFLPNGIQEATATSGTFMGVSRSTTPQWVATDGRSGDTSTKALSEQMIQGALRAGRRYGANSFFCLLGDPAGIDLFVQGLMPQRLYNPDNAQLKTGWYGPVYNGAVGVQPFSLVSEPYYPKGKAVMFDRAEITIYGDEAGPSFLEDDGARFRRFTRALPKEAELVDRVNVMYTNLSRIVYLNNLDSAS